MMVLGQKHLTTCYVNKYSATVEPPFVELGYFEFLAISHSNYFPLNRLFSDFLSANPKPRHLELRFVMAIINHDTLRAGTPSTALRDKNYEIAQCNRLSNSIFCGVKAKSI